MEYTLAQVETLWTNANETYENNIKKLSYNVICRLPWRLTIQSEETSKPRNFSFCENYKQILDISQKREESCIHDLYFSVNPAWKL